MQPAQDCQFVFVSVGTEQNASEISKALVEKRLAACVSRFPNVTSVYSWKGVLQEDQEFLMIIKTQKDLVEEVSNVVRRLHTYEVPEIVSVSIDRASEDYLSWLRQAVRK